MIDVILEELDEAISREADVEFKNLLMEMKAFLACRDCLPKIIKTDKSIAKRFLLDNEVYGIILRKSEEDAEKDGFLFDKEDKHFVYIDGKNNKILNEFQLYYIDLVKQSVAKGNDVRAALDNVYSLINRQIETLKWTQWDINDKSHLQTIRDILNKIFKDKFKDSSYESMLRLKPEIFDLMDDYLRTVKMIKDIKGFSLNNMLSGPCVLSADIPEEYRFLPLDKSVGALDEEKRNKMKSIINFDEKESGLEVYNRIKKEVYDNNAYMASMKLADIFCGAMGQNKIIIFNPEEIKNVKFVKQIDK